MTGAVETFRVERGEVVAPGCCWVYLWREDDAGDASVVYVGATRIHPAARTEKHLRDPDPDVGRLRARYPAAGGDLARPFTVHAVPVASSARRALVRARVAWLVSESGRRSPRWCCDAPAAPSDPLTPDEEACAQTLVASLG